MGKEKKAGVIYILTNPSFPDYVKIGYATDIEKDWHSLIEASASLLRSGSMRFMRYRPRCKTKNCTA